MSERMVHFTVRQLALAVVLTLGHSASAQQTVDVTPSSNSDEAETTRPVPAALAAPSSILGNRAVNFDQLPTGPQAIILNDNSAQWKKFLDERKNWALMTPREIMGVPTPESILGVQDLDDELGLTVEQRYLRRLDRGSESGATNSASRGANDDLDRDLKLIGNRDDAGRLGSFSSFTGIDAANSVKNGGALKGGRGDGNQTAAVSAWSSAFQSQTVGAKETQEQLAGMERFREFMGGSAAPKTATLSASAGVIATADAKARTTASEQASHTYTTVGDSFGKPTVLIPFGQATPLPTTTKKVSWVQPPPWLTSPTLPTPGTQKRQF